MKKKLFATAALVAALGVSGGAGAEDLLEGQERLSCEAWLCLSGGVSRTPTECAPSLLEYNLLPTPFEKQKFLALCPKTLISGSPSGTSVISSDEISGQNSEESDSDRCAATYLNSTLREDNGYKISDRMPSYCQVGGISPRYVGVPDEGGYWVEAENYAGAMADYKLGHVKHDIQIETIEQNMP